MNLKIPFNNSKLPINYLLKNGSIIDPDKNTIETKDILIEGKIIKALKKNISVDEKKFKIIDCNNFFISPGIVDMRVNIGEPGFEHKETIKSACKAAASGGVTSIVCMPNTYPAIDQPAIIQSIQRKAREVSLSKVFCTGCITRGAEGNEICELQLMREFGALGFTDGNRSVSNARVMKRALNYAKSFDGLIIQHAEEPELSQGGMVNEGEFATRMGLTGIPNYSESMIIERDLWLVRDTKCRYHVSHISTKESVEIIRSHVTDGVKLAKKFKIPEAVYRGIIEHHGDSVMRYFYEKEKLTNPEVTKDDFRHLGEKPSSKETVILMFADALEAACRARFQYEDADEEKISNLVNEIFEEKINDGQLLNAPITFQDLEKIKQSFQASLEGLYHQRVLYPEFTKDEEE